MRESTIDAKSPRLIETDAFPFEFLSPLAERESWRKEIHRPIYHMHKWWAKRLGSVFRGILLGCALPKGESLEDRYYESHDLSALRVLDPFMGSGTTIGEAHKLGFTALGRDINPVAVRLVRVALGRLEEPAIRREFERLEDRVAGQLRALYRSVDSTGRKCDVLYYFWVMLLPCPSCGSDVELFSSWVFARNAYPRKKPEVQVRCPACESVFTGMNGRAEETCPSCRNGFDPRNGPAKRSTATCRACDTSFRMVDAAGHTRPAYRLYAKLVLTSDGKKEYLPATPEDRAAYASAQQALETEMEAGRIMLPQLSLESGYNTRQAMRYGFRTWRDFFNDRQLLAIGMLHREILRTEDAAVREALLTLFSGTLEFNNLFASYKGEGTGAVRHMFAHHILKPERMPIEANLWGTQKSSGSFSTLFRSRVLRAIEYRMAPTEVNGVSGGKGRVCSRPFSGEVLDWPSNGSFKRGGIFLSCADSSTTNLPENSIDLVVTDPPFFDNVHYSELADFFFAWQQLGESSTPSSTRDEAEVQDPDAEPFAEKLASVFREMRRVLKDDGLLVFTYHHSREEGWRTVTQAIRESGFCVVNAHPVKSEMSVATPKSQAKSPIQLDIIIVCRKCDFAGGLPVASDADAERIALEKTNRLSSVGIELSENDKAVIRRGQRLTRIPRVECS